MISYKTTMELQVAKPLSSKMTRQMTAELEATLIGFALKHGLKVACICLALETLIDRMN